VFLLLISVVTIPYNIAVQYTHCGNLQLYYQINSMSSVFCAILPEVKNWYPKESQNTVTRKGMGAGGCVVRPLRSAAPAEYAGRGCVAGEYGGGDAGREDAGG